MKPAGANYKPNRMVIGKIPDAEKETPPSQDGGYMTARVMSATPQELILIMFEQFLELIPDIKNNIRKKSHAAAEPDSERAQAIVDELINSLDFSVEMSRDLGAIYFYVRDRILEANLRFDAAIWDHIEATMRPLYEGFKEAARSIEQDEKHGGAAAAVRPVRGPSIVAGITYGQSSLKEIVVNTKTGLRI